MATGLGYINNTFKGDNYIRAAYGTIALDGTNPTPIATGLSELVGGAATLVGAAAPGVGTSLITCVLSPNGVMNLYAWKVTGTGDATLVASSGTETVSWVAFGT